MSPLYEYFETRWLYGTVEIEQLEAAVVKGYITQEEFTKITEQKQY